MMDRKCIGFLGWLFGHKFAGHEHHWAYCLRCGMPEGGWGS